MLDPSTHNRPFADKRDKMGMDGVLTDSSVWESVLITGSSKLDFLVHFKTPFVTFSTSSIVWNT